MSIYENRNCEVCKKIFQFRISCQRAGRFCSKQCSDIERTDNLEGQRFGRIIVGEQIQRKKTKRVSWSCICNCGNITIVYASALIAGSTKSCGCLQKENLKKRKTTHGLRYTRFYNIYHSMYSRCNSKNYLNYSGIGIKCLWKSFEEFRDDMYESYKAHCKQFGEKQTTIDRIDNNGNYCKENCRWANNTAQQRNKRSNVLITYLGKTKCLGEWAKSEDIKYMLLYKRIVMRKWSIERAFNTPIINR